MTRQVRGGYRFVVVLVVVLVASICLATVGADRSAATTRSSSSRRSQNAARLWSPTSFLQMQVPAQAAISPSSQDWASRLYDLADYGLFVNYGYWTVPIYHAKASTPLVSIAIANHHTRIRIPYIPAFRQDATADGQLAIIDDATGCDYEFQGFDPQSMSAMAEATYRLHAGTGLHTSGAGATGSDISLLGGLITPGDVAAGVITHALRYATPINAPTFVPPANRSDGSVQGGIPEGQLMRLDPSLDLSQFGLSPFQLMVARALQIYGAYDADSAGSFTLYAEDTIDGSRYSKPIEPLPRTLLPHLEFMNAAYPRNAVAPDTNSNPVCHQQLQGTRRTHRG